MHIHVRKSSSHAHDASSQLGVPSQAPYTFPETFSIGHKQTTGPLVTPSQLKGHLGLMRQFWDLRQKVESANQDSRLPAFTTRMDSELRWAYFVTLAVDRFERWVKNMPVSSTPFCFPPIDVIMVWHAYLLNPGCVEFLLRSIISDYGFYHSGGLQRIRGELRI